MKTQPAANRIQAFTRNELFVVIGVIVVLAALLLTALSVAKRKTSRITCVDHLHQIGVCFKVWEGENGEKYPMQFALTNSETMKLIGSGNAWVLWQTMSNMLGTPQILHCPEDVEHTETNRFTSDFSDANISYFFSLEAADTYPQMILDGDDNLAVDGVRVKPGILNFPTTSSLAWTKERHHGVGNFGMADGSVMQTTSSSLSSAIIAATNGTPANTFRLVIP
ncbi:MAG: hypothetical protein WAO21_08425 [Verrucomicrobiia bacterium]|jgi:hypothetical protein